MSVTSLQRDSTPRRFKSANRRQSGVQRITALKHQAAMLASNKKFMLLVAGYGAGKSHALHLCAALDVVQYPGIKVLVLAPSYDLLRLNNVPGILQILEEWGIRYQFNKSEYIIHILDYKAQIILRSMDNPSRIVAFEVARSYIDEADIPTLTQMELAWNKTLGRTRQVLRQHNGDIISNRVWAFSTPEGFKFCYKRWVKLGGREYGIVRAKTVDNPYLPSDFVQSLLDTYPEQLIEAYLNGEFVNLTSGSVYYSFDRLVHHVDTVERPREELILGMDFNVNKQATVVYVKRNEAYHAVWEFKNLKDTPETIKQIQNRFPEHPIFVYPDATGRAEHTTGAGKSDHSLLKKAGFIVKARRSNPLVKDRVASVNNAFEKGLLYVNTERCPEFTEALEQQIYNVNGQPDKSTGHDHINDAGGYPIASILPITDRRSYMSVVSL